MYSSTCAYRLFRLNNVYLYYVAHTYYSLEDVLQSVLNSSRGYYRWREKDIHALHEHLILPDYHSKLEGCAFWLCRILKPWPPASQAKLFFILCADTFADGYDGETITSCTVCYKLLPRAREARTRG